MSNVKVCNDNMQPDGVTFEKHVIAVQTNNAMQLNDAQKMPVVYACTCTERQTEQQNVKKVGMF